MSVRRAWSKTTNEHVVAARKLRNRKKEAARVVGFVHQFFVQTGIRRTKDSLGVRLYVKNGSSIRGGNHIASRYHTPGTASERRYGPDCVSADTSPVIHLLPIRRETVDPLGA